MLNRALQLLDLELSAVRTALVEVWFTASGGAAVYKSGVLVGSYTRNDSNIAPAAGAVYLNSVNSQFITIMMIPCRRRELIVVASNGLSFELSASLILLALLSLFS